MENFPLILVLITTQLKMPAQAIAPKPNEPQTSFTLTIDNIENAQQPIYVGFYTEEDRFPKQGKHQFRKVIYPTGGSVSKTWNDIPEGEYAIAIYQDVNENDQLETNLLGLPQEPYGFSTNFRAGVFSIPTFGKCKVMIDDKHSEQAISFIR